MGNLLEKITDPTTIMIRVIGLMARCFWFLWKFLGFLYFSIVSTYDPRWLHVQVLKEPLISNIKIFEKNLLITQATTKKWYLLEINRCDLVHRVSVRWCPFVAPLPRVCIYMYKFLRSIQGFHFSLICVSLISFIYSRIRLL